MKPAIIVIIDNEAEKKTLITNFSSTNISTPKYNKNNEFNFKIIVV